MLANWKPLGVLGVGVGLFLMGQVIAQETRTQRQETQQHQAQAGQHKACLASKLTGVAVKDKSDQAIGKIQDLVIDSQGQVLYLAIVAQAAPEGGQAQKQPTDQQPAEQDAAQQQRQKAIQAALNAKLTLIPFEAAKFHAGKQPAQMYVSVDVDQAKLKNAPSFTVQQLSADEGQQAWMAQVDKHFGIKERRGVARPELNENETPQKKSQRQ